MPTPSLIEFKKTYYKSFDFQYSQKEFDNTKTYQINEEVIYFNEVNFTLKLYKSLVNGNTSLPTDTNNWQILSTDINKAILDSHILQYLQESWNQVHNRFGDYAIQDEIYLKAVYLLTAHDLTLNVIEYDVDHSAKLQSLITTNRSASSGGSFSVSKDINGLNNIKNLRYQLTKYGIMYLELLKEFIPNIITVRSDEIIE